jgi:hypothetical protein
VRRLLQSSNGSREYQRSTRRTPSDHSDDASPSAEIGRLEPAAVEPGFEFLLNEETATSAWHSSMRDRAGAGQFVNRANRAAKHGSYLCRVKVRAARRHDRIVGEFAAERILQSR